MGKVVSWWLWCNKVWVPHGLLQKGSSFLFILHKSQHDIKMSQCSPKTNSCSHCTPGPHPQKHNLRFTQRRSSAALSYRNGHVSYYLSSCRWPRAASSRLISWMAGSWSCWFRYIFAVFLFPEIGFNKTNGLYLSNLIFLYPAKAVVTWPVRLGRLSFYPEGERVLWSVFHRWQVRIFKTTVSVM